MKLPERIDRAAGGLAADAALYGLSAVFALVTALTSTLLPHRAWGAVATWGYLAAFLVVVVQLLLRKPAFRRELTWLAWGATTLLPMVVQSVQRAAGRTDRAQEEVLVAEHMGERLAHTGTPYLSREAITALPTGDQLLGYSPYQPGMAVFGLPRAAFGDFWWTDARIWFALVTAGALIAALRLLRDQVRPLQVATVFPICALTLATGGDDLPVLALCLLALAFCVPGRFGAAGLAIGAAAALKLFAFPVLAVLLILAITQGGLRRFLPGAIGLPILTLLPTFLVDGDAFVENVLRFPLGHGVVTSPAQSPFPGYLIAQAVPGGRYLALGLLVTAGLAIAVRLLRRPPRTAAAAAYLSGYGLLAAILLMPTTRFGYLMYPLALLVWAGSLTSAPTFSRPTGTTPPRSDTASYNL
ncbi:glycosyltransferase 87 family protein [Actinoplanes sp. NPDC051494]|uniref:glycosyltransferase 87 family protein n=1 Tax=Actinoplanes sp. NPDC051494 TaxID=3363907 RepID=UPI0037A16A9C